MDWSDKIAEGNQFFFYLVFCPIRDWHVNCNPYGFNSQQLPLWGRWTIFQSQLHCVVTRRELTEPSEIKMLFNHARKQFCKTRHLEHIIESDIKVLKIRALGPFCTSGKGCLFRHISYHHQHFTSVDGLCNMTNLADANRSLKI